MPVTMPYVVSRLPPALQRSHERNMQFAKRRREVIAAQVKVQRPRGHEELFEVLFLDTVLDYLGSSAAEIGKLGLLCHGFRPLLFPTPAEEAEGAFEAVRERVMRALCDAACHSRGTFLPWTRLHALPSGSPSWRAYFTRRVWPAIEGRQQDGPDDNPFNVWVGVRFRPGKAKASSVVVPLHQRLLLLKKGETLVEVEPERFKDALLGTLMTDPVMLPRSRQICDRRVLAMHFRKSRRDPFDPKGGFVSPEQLIPCPKLAEEIREWQAKRSGPPEDKEGVRVSEDGMRALARKVAGEVREEVLDAVLEAERLAADAEEAATGVPRVVKRKKQADTCRHRALAPWDSVEPEVEEEEGEEQAAAAIAEVAEGRETAPQEPSQGSTADQTALHGQRPSEQVAAHVRDCPRVVEVSSNRVVAFQPGNGVRQFVYQHCFSGEDDACNTNDAAFRETGMRCVERTLDGGDSCVLCYGQTGSGKTHTVFGSNKDPGLAPRALSELLRVKHLLERDPSVTVTLTARYAQLYCGVVSCLLSKSAGRLCSEGGVNGCEERVLSNQHDVELVLQDGEANKQFAETAMNHRSSRSHSVLVVGVRQQFKSRVISSSLTLVDLAGSERVKKSGATCGDLFKETTSINLSLCSLERCVNALRNRMRHIPYRDSPLTLLLKPVLSRGCTTAFLVCCRSDDEHAGETLQSLIFATSLSEISAAAAKAAADPLAALNLIDHSIALCREKLAGIHQDSAIWRRLSCQLAALVKKRQAISESETGGKSFA